MVIWGIEMGKRVRWAFALAAAEVVSTCLNAPQAFAGEPYGGVTMVIATGEHLTGAAAAREYDALRRQPAINCGSCRKYVVITAQKMPFIARNINMAFKAGKPFELHKVNQTLAGANERKHVPASRPATRAVATSTPLPAAARAAPVPRRKRCRCGSSAARAGHCDASTLHSRSTTAPSSRSSSST
jgi:hypothetical protein